MTSEVPPQPSIGDTWIVDCRYDPRRPKSWYLLHDYWRDVLLEDDRVIKIRAPYGFEWDSASVPPRLQGIIPRWGRHTPASLCHDWLYVTKKVDRKTADAVFIAAMKEDGIGWIKRNIMWSAVRVGGWVVWRR